MVKVLNILQPPKQPLKVFKGLDFRRINFLSEIIPDTIIIKNKPVFQNIGLFFVSDDLKNNILKTDLAKIKISVDKNKLSIPQSPLLEKSLNSFLETFPNFIGVFKHPKNDIDGLDIHTLKTFKEVLNHNDYKNLTDKEKNILNLASLFHDLGKIDKKGKKHVEYSKIRTKEILKDQNIAKEDKKVIIQLVGHHYWNKIVTDKPQKMKKYSEIFTLETLPLLKILAEADIKSRINILPATKNKMLQELERNYKQQKKHILKKQPLPKGRPSVFVEDNEFRAGLASNLNVPKEHLQSVVGVNEFKFLLKNKFKPKNFLPGENDSNVKKGFFRANFHIHTVNSDGKFNAQELLDTAKKHSEKIKKPVYFATTDHNNVNANKQVLEILAKNHKEYKNIRFITGIEIRNYHKEENGKHISYETLAYGINPYKKDYNEFLPHGKFERTSEEVAEFFRDEDVVLSLAHPQRIPCDNLKNFIGEVFVANNGKALEAYYSYSEAGVEEWAKDYNFKPDNIAIEEIKALAEEFQLPITGGRDSHSKNFFHRR